MAWRCGRSTDHSTVVTGGMTTQNRETGRPSTTPSRQRLSWVVVDGVGTKEIHLETFEQRGLKYNFRRSVASQISTNNTNRLAGVGANSHDFPRRLAR